MKPYVLVHGAWHGGWCWRDTARLLRAAGHEVYTPTLTGLADRAHMISPDLTVDTHIADIAGLLRYEDLKDVVLVGHSYAGAVITGVADGMPERIDTLVYLDARLPGVSEPLPPPDPAHVVGVPPPAAEAFGVPEPFRAWVDSQMTPQPVGCRRDDYQPTGGADSIRRKAYMVCPDWFGGARTTATADHLSTDPRWEILRTDWGHDMMVDRPSELAAYLLQFA